jgi:poly(3-hydroxybutyrate) depolymerase
MKEYLAANLFRVVLIAAIILLNCCLSAAPIPYGSSQIEVGAGTNAITVYTYKPKTYLDGPILFVFHGLLRNAQGYRDDCIALADRYKLIVVAPLFDTNRFPGSAYQRGGLIRHGALQAPTNWTYNLLPPIVTEVRQREGNTNLPYYFIGHSAGAQFLMRLAAFCPLKAQRIVVANPGSNLFPRRDWKFGYGFGGLPEELSDDEALQRYLSAPLTVYLGTADTDPQHPELDRSPEAELEGRFRLERGRACFKYAKKLAKENGWIFNWRIVEAPGIGHDARQMFNGKRVGEALFGNEQPITAEAYQQIKSQTK